MRRIKAEIERLERKLLAISYEEYALLHPGTEKGKDDPIFNKKRKHKTFAPKQTRPIPWHWAREKQRTRHVRPKKKKKPHKPVQPYLSGVQPKKPKRHLDRLK